MKFAKLLSLGLVSFALLSCNQSQKASKIENTVEAANTPQEKQSAPQQTEDKPSQEFSSNKKNPIRRQIGSRFDCNGDGKANGARIDTNSDGIPDECIESDEKAFNNNSSGKAAASSNSSQKGIIDETSFETISKSLAAITEGCNKTKTTKNGNNYEICKKGDTVVNTSEYNVEVGAGLAYWFSSDGRVVAARYLANGDLYIFNSNGKVSSKIDVYESKKINNISAEDRKQAEENLYFNYKDILKVFNI